MVVVLLNNLDFLESREGVFCPQTVSPSVIFCPPRFSAFLCRSLALFAFPFFPLLFFSILCLDSSRRSSQLAVSSRIFSLSFGGILKAKQRERFVPTLPPPTTDDHTTTPPAEREMAKIPGHTLCRPSLMKGWHPIPIPQRKQSL